MDIRKLVKSIAIPVIVGIVVSLIMMPFNDYKDLIQPPLAPPSAPDSPQALLSRFPYDQ